MACGTSFKSFESLGTDYGEEMLEDDSDSESDNESILPNQVKEQPFMTPIHGEELDIVTEKSGDDESENENGKE